MKWRKIDLKNIIAVGHDPDQLGLLIDRGNEIEYLEVPAPKAAFEGLKQVADYSNGKKLPPQRRQPIALFANDSGVFNRVENQSRVEVESAQLPIDKVSRTSTWEMLGTANLTIDESALPHHYYNGLREEIP